MKQITKYLNTKVNPSKIIATDETIYRIVKSEIDRFGPVCNLNHIDVSKVTHMRELFSKDYDEDFRNKINPDVSKWNVENLVDGWCMFYYCRGFDQDISGWDLASIESGANMFYKCHKLKTAPKLSQLKLKYEIYFGMFAECKNLVYAPELPATNLEIGCYMHMFNRCTNLEVGPDLPATKLVRRCYNYMFFECPKIKEENIKIAASLDDIDKDDFVCQMFGHE